MMVLALIPILMGRAEWSARYDPETIAPKEFVEHVSSHRDEMFTLITQTVRDGGAIFTGDKSIVNNMK